MVLFYVEVQSENEDYFEPGCSGGKNILTYELNIETFFVKLTVTGEYKVSFQPLPSPFVPLLFLITV